MTLAAPWGIVRQCGTCPLFQEIGQGHCLVRLVAVTAGCHLEISPTRGSGEWVSLAAGCMVEAEVEGPVNHVGAAVAITIYFNSLILLYAWVQKDGTYGMQ